MTPIQKAVYLKAREEHYDDGSASPGKMQQLQKLK
jgi:hypothetical protein